MENNNEWNNKFFEDDIGVVIPFERYFIAAMVEDKLVIKLPEGEVFNTKPIGKVQLEAYKRWLNGEIIEVLKEERDCTNCKFEERSRLEPPCHFCNYDFSYWEAK